MSGAFHIAFQRGCLGQRHAPPPEVHSVYDEQAEADHEEGPLEPIDLTVARQEEGPAGDYEHHWVLVPDRLPLDWHGSEHGGDAEDCAQVEDAGPDDVAVGDVGRVPGSSIQADGEFGHAGAHGDHRESHHRGRDAGQERHG